MKFTALTLGLAATALAAPSAPLEARQETAVQATDRLLFSVSLSTFLAARAAKNPSTVSWVSNGCSYSPDNPFGFNFLDSCHRHDFGYRNYKDQNRFTDAARLRIDDKFKADMYNQCNAEGGSFAVGACKGVANVYYSAVRALGGVASAKREITAAEVREAMEDMVKRGEIVWDEEFEKQMLELARSWEA